MRLLPWQWQCCCAKRQQRCTSHPTAFETTHSSEGDWLLPSHKRMQDVKNIKKKKVVQKGMFWQQCSWAQVPVHAEYTGFWCSTHTWWLCQRHLAGRSRQAVRLQIDATRTTNTDAQLTQKSIAGNRVLLSTALYGQWLTAVAEDVPLATGRRMWLQRDRGSPHFSRRNRISGRKLWRTMDWVKLTARWPTWSADWNALIRFLSVGQYEVGVHHAGNLKGRHQSVKSMKDATFGSSCGSSTTGSTQTVWYWVSGTCAGMTLILYCCCER